ncbi:MAG: hypothetical protein HC905_15775 [Bacteroidales bacterium]|nr:hypothetical protein [Bacteroidales bacterium]
MPDGAFKAGIYAQSFRIFDAITMISVLFASLLLPMFSKQLSKNENIRPLTQLAFSFLFTGTVSLAIILTAFSHEILNYLYVESHTESARVFTILSICAVPVSLTYIFGSLMTAGGKLLQLNIVAGVTLIINLSLNLTLIPAWGITGAAVATITAQLFAATAQIIFCIRYYKF